MRNVSGNAAAVTKSTWAGIGIRFSAGTDDELGVAAVGLQAEHVVARAVVVATGAGTPRRRRSAARAAA